MESCGTSSSQTRLPQFGKYLVLINTVLDLIGSKLSEHSWTLHKPIQWTDTHGLVLRRSNSEDTFPPLSSSQPCVRESQEAEIAHRRTVWECHRAVDDDGTCRTNSDGCDRRVLTMNKARMDLPHFDAKSFVCALVPSFR